ncbi:MAG: YitT family protein [Proteobacteria bacterium]|nr:YitT family protein [Pseudomonadota bacterium]
MTENFCEIPADTGSAGHIPVRSVLSNVALITAGALLYAVGLNGILVPQKFIAAGFTGVALMLHYLWPVLGVGALYLILNLPLAILGFFGISRTFIAYSILGIGIFSAAAALVKVPAFPIGDPFLAAILAGVICGAGGGLILRSRGSAGGLDILSVYIHMKWSLRIGGVVAMLNAVVLTAGALVFDLTLALYSLVFVYVSGRVTDAVITGFNRKKVVMIVSDRSREISDLILASMDRGVTLLHGMGGYSGQDKEVIMSVITLTELAKMKDLVFSLDPAAFVVVNDTLEVLGTRHGSLRVY